MNILVTGFPRSGTTVIGRAIATARAVRYVHEPFNSNFPALGTRFRARGFWRPLGGCRDDEERFARLETVFSFRPSIPDVTRSDLRQSKVHSIRRVVHALVPSPDMFFNRHVLMKDPQAVCSMDLIARRFEASVILLIRDPVGVAGSMQRYGWRICPRFLLDQSSIARWIDDSERAMLRELSSDASPTADLKTFALCWKIVHRLIGETISEVSSIKIIDHRDLSSDPEGTMRDAIRFLGLEVDSRFDRFIEATCGAKSSSNDPRPFDIRRSKDVRDNRKVEALPADQEAVVRKITGPYDEWFDRLSAATESRVS